MQTHTRILVVAAHPDDEILGCGAFCARMARQGSHISVLILGEGATARQGSGQDGSMDQAVAALRLQACEAASVIGASRPVFGGLPDNRFDSIPLLEIVRIIEDVKGQVRPTLVLTHHGGDLNIDHTLTHRAVMTAFRPLPGAAPLDIWAFEVLSSTEYAQSPGFLPFTPTLFVGAQDHLETKIQAMRAYSSELNPAPHPRSEAAIRALAARRGHQAGLHSAEAFALLRSVRG